MRCRWSGLVAVLLFVPSLKAADFSPDPRSVQREGAGYRYPQAGWIVLHIEGEPYQRGYQHGKLLAPEIVGYIRCFAALQCDNKAPEAAWRNLRTLVNSLFLRRFAPEYLEEMRGIADGATAAGAKFDDKPIDLVDIAALNVWPEVETLGESLEALPTGLEGKRFEKKPLKNMPIPKGEHCSAFAATGPATADGKVVFGHITMFGLYAGRFYNVWLDVKPANGHRVLMQSFPGGIQSGMDYYLNDAGLLVTETTIAQTRFDASGMALASRIRQALQYADSIDGAVDILKQGNNGLYTNEWLLADTKTNEIAMFELGTHASKLYRSSKGEWFGGTEGFYWGCNNTKDLQVRLETVASVNDRPSNVVWRPTDRDRVWHELYTKWKGKINADFGREAFTTAPLAAFHSLDAKCTTTDLAKQLKTVALFGPPLGRTWQPTLSESKTYPEIRPLVSNPWTILHPNAPEPDRRTVKVADLPAKMKPDDDKDDDDGPTHPAWHGTLLPKSDADTWLAAAFADYERWVARENKVTDDAKNGKLSPAEREKLSVALAANRSGYLAAARAAGDQPLAQTQATPGNEWYKVASGKGVLVLNELRQLLGATPFEELMDGFGRAHAGEAVGSDEFVAHVKKVAGPKVDGFFEYWLNQPGLPTLKLAGARRDAIDAPAGGHRVTGTIERPAGLPRAMVEVTVESTTGAPTTKTVELDGPSTKFAVETKNTPTRVVLDAGCRTAKANGGVFSVLNFHDELTQTLIVYGTGDEEEANRQTAEALQQGIRARRWNITVPVRSDKQINDEDLRNHHLLLIGRPDCNAVVERFRAGWPIEFGTRSFKARKETFAHMATAVVAAGANPANGRYSMVVLAGLSAEATTLTPDLLLKQAPAGAEVVVKCVGMPAKAMVLPARELIVDLAKSSKVAAAKQR